MAERKSIGPLILGLALMVLGGFFFLSARYGFELRWLGTLKLLIPAVLLWIGLSRLFRHFTWEEAELVQRPRKNSLLVGIFFTCLGVVVLLELTMDINALEVFGTYWPLILMLFGLGKIVDFYRLPRAFPLRAREVVGVLFIILLGFASGRAASFPFGLVDFDIPLITVKGRQILLGEIAGRKHQWESEEAFSTEGLQEVEIANLYGDIRIQTEPIDDIHVRLTKVVFHNSEERARQIAEQIELSSQVDDGALRLTTNRVELDRSSKFNTHWLLRIPEEMTAQLMVLNAYGKIQVSGVRAPCDLKNSHGEVEVDDVVGDLRIVNQYRPVTVAHLEGDLIIENRRGGVRVEDVRGTVDLSTDHAPLSAQKVQGDLRARNHFGSVRVAIVTGAVTIQGSGSEVRVEKVEKIVKIENSHKQVRVMDISAGLEVDTSHSRIELADIQGDTLVRSIHSEVNGERLRGAVTVQARSSAIDLSEVSGPLNLSTSFREMRVSRFHSAAQVQNEYADVLLFPDGPLSGPLSASNRNGEIELSISAGLDFKLSAQAPGGRVVSDFRPSAIGAGQDVQVLEFVSGSGKPEIRLQTAYAEITVKKD